MSVQRHLTSKHEARHFQKGFTLLEVLIAITITGLIGVGTYQLFASTMRTQEVMEERGTRLEKIQRAMAFISRDFQQLAPRAVRNEYGDQDFAISNRNALYLLELTRLGWRNPLGDPRSEIQRVSYELDENILYRNYYAVLDRAQDSEPLSQPLLDEVESFQVRFLDEQNEWHDDWPTDRLLNQSTEDRYSALPKAVEISLTHTTFGFISRIYDVVGYYQTPTAKPGGQSGDDNNAENNGDNSGINIESGSPEQNDSGQGGAGGLF